MRITVYVHATFYDDIERETSGGFMTHVITLSNEDALERLVEHFQGPALDILSQDDCLVYDDEKD